jgi:pteridine reductase
MRTAVVTGAGIRVGRAIALALADAGFDVVAHANKSKAEVEETADLIRNKGRQASVELADLADDDAVDALADRIAAAHPVVDVLVHSAGFFEKVPFERVTRAQYRAMQRVNVEAPYFLTQRLLPCLERASDPNVVHVVDIAAERPMNRYSHYSVSKAGLLMLTRALTVELGPKVRVNGVSPGTVAFPEHFSQDERDKILARIPLRREGHPDDIARAVVFLVTSPYMSGAVIPVDGGRAVVL